MNVFRILGTIYTAPGYALLWLNYYFPNEWSSDRNVARSARQWQNRPIMAIIRATGFWLAVGLIFFFSAK
jgi:hypothetical protein